MWLKVSMFHSPDRETAHYYRKFDLNRLIFLNYLNKINASDPMGTYRILHQNQRIYNLIKHMQNIYKNLPSQSYKENLNKVTKLESYSM